MVLTLTFNPALDLSTSISGLKPEKKMRCDSPEYFPGGGGINVSRALLRLGLQSTAMFVSGGPGGKLIETLLKDEQISTKAIETEKWTRENLTVFDKSNKLQYRFTFPGLPMERENQIKVLNAVKDLDPFPDFIVLSGSFPPDFPLHFIKDLQLICGSKNSKLIVDTSGPFLLEAAKAGVFFMKPNYEELCEMLDLDAKDLHDLKEVARSVIAKFGIEILLVSMGANGASIVTNDQFFHIAAPKVPVKSTVGAGDSMLAGAIYAISKGFPLKTVLKWGVSCGTATTMNEGTGLFQADEVEKVMNLIS